MTTEELKAFEFSNSDFELIDNALERLNAFHAVDGGFPKEATNAIIELLCEGDIVRSNEIKRKWAEVKKGVDMENKSMHEEIRILQGKLFCLKRVMEQNKILTDAKNTLNIK